MLRQKPFASRRSQSALDGAVPGQASSLLSAKRLSDSALYNQSAGLQGGGRVERRCLTRARCCFRRHQKQSAQVCTLLGPKPSRKPGFCRQALRERHYAYRYGPRPAKDRIRDPSHEQPDTAYRALRSSASAMRLQARAPGRPGLCFHRKSANPRLGGDWALYLLSRHLRAHRAPCTRGCPRHPRKRPNQCDYLERLEDVAGRARPMAPT